MRRPVLMTAVIAAFTLSVLSGCGDKTTTFGRSLDQKMAQLQLDNERRAGNGGLYYLGNRFGGMAVSAAGDGHIASATGASVPFKEIGYGTCTVSREQGCLLPLTVRTMFLDPSFVQEAHGASCQRLPDVRGVAAARLNGTLTLFPGRDLVALYGSRAGERAAGSLQTLDGLITKEMTLPPTAPDVLMVLDDRCPPPR